MKTALTVVVLLSIMIGCSPLTIRPQQHHRQLATRILTEQNFSEITIKPWGIQNVFGCSQDDIFRTRFRAKNMSGKTVNGVVCSGFFKGSTVRVF
jgi:hypothetical protein